MQILVCLFFCLFVVVVFFVENKGICVRQRVSVFVKASLIMLVTFIEFGNAFGIDIVLIALQKKLS